jgi:Zn-dependent metalloprotease
VAAHGDTHQRERVTATLADTEHLISDRAATLIDPHVQAPAQKTRQVYDAGHHQILPGKLVMTEERLGSSDVEAKEAFDGSGATYDFYAQVFLRHSIDDRGMRLNSTVHYGRRFDNAMWNGRQMVYGDGDGKLFNRFTAAVDVVGHELTHGVTQHSAALEYQGQSGALNEHVSDAFGIMVKQYRFGTTAVRSDWLIGEGLLAKGIRGVAIRSMKEPGTAYDDPVLGKDPQPSHMSKYVDGADDNGGVHINSGIPNHAFYLAATALRGYAWSVAGRVWYRVLTAKLFPKAQFQDFANSTVSAAGELYGIGGNVQLTVADAWSAVGLHVPLSLTRSGGGAGKRRRTGGSTANA